MLAAKVTKEGYNIHGVLLSAPVEPLVVQFVPRHGQPQPTDYRLAIVGDHVVIDREQNTDMFAYRIAAAMASQDIPPKGRRFSLDPRSGPPQAVLDRIKADAVKLGYDVP